MDPTSGASASSFTRLLALRSRHAPSGTTTSPTRTEKAPNSRISTPLSIRAPTLRKARTVPYPNGMAGATDRHGSRASPTIRSPSPRPASGSWKRTPRGGLSPGPPVRRLAGQGVANALARTTPARRPRRGSRAPARTAPPGPSGAFPRGPCDRVGPGTNLVAIRSPAWWAEHRPGRSRARISSLATASRSARAGGWAGAPGGRWTYGVCEGALSWAVEPGRATWTSTGSLPCSRSVTTTTSPDPRGTSSFMSTSGATSTARRAAVDPHRRMGRHGDGAVPLGVQAEPAARRARRPDRGASPCASSWFRAGDYVVSAWATRLSSRSR